jgi:hypothetical protein
MDTPKWAPGSVRSAYGLGPDDASDLVTGRSWQRLLESLGRTGQVLRFERSPSEEADRTAGYRHLRGSDPYRPRFAPANVDNVLKWGMDCPDAAYSGAALRDDATYVVRGRRSSVRHLGLQVMGGMEDTGNVVADDLGLDDEGRFELVLSAAEHPGHWMLLAAGSTSLVVRQFFYDWARVVPLTQVDDQLPEGTARVDGPERQRTLDARRQAVLRRFPR